MNLWAAGTFFPTLAYCVCESADVQSNFYLVILNKYVEDPPIKHCYEGMILIGFPYSEHIRLFYLLYTMFDFQDFGLIFAGQMSCLPQSLKLMLFEIFLNRGCPKGIRSVEKISNNIDFSPLRQTV